MSRVAEKIKEARLKAGMTQKALGKKLRVAEKFINEVENGRKIVQESFIEKAAKILNADLNDGAGVQRVHLIHFVFCQFKIENTEVAGNSHRVGGLGQHDQAALYFKSKDDLASILAILLCQLGDNRVGEQAAVPVAQRLISLDLYIVSRQQFPQLPLLEEGVALHLVHRREDLELGDEFLPDLRGHVADTDRPDLSLGLGLLQGLPCARHIAVWLVEQVEVHIIHPQLLQRGVQTLCLCVIKK